VLALLDASFAGAADRSALPAGASPPERIREPFVAPRAIVLSAASGKEGAGRDADGKGGLFTSLLLEGIGEAKSDRNADGLMTLKEIVQWVTPRVAQQARRAGRDQTPSLFVGRDLDAAVFVAAQRLQP
jgi:hypothetical protein